MRLKTRARKKRHRERLFAEQNGLCYWCGVEMVMWTYVKGAQSPPNEATVDHLDSRLSPDRGTYQSTHDRRHVMACSLCNHERARLEEAALPIEELWRRSSRHAA